MQQWSLVQPPLAGMAALPQELAAWLMINGDLM